jgi:hypothetical protein
MIAVGNLYGLPDMEAPESSLIELSEKKTFYLVVTNTVEKNDI